VSNNPHSFRKHPTITRGYTVTEKISGRELGTVDRVSPDHVKLHPKWRAIATDGTDLGSYHYSRDAAAHALADRHTELAAIAERVLADADDVRARSRATLAETAPLVADVPPSEELVAELAADARAAYAAGRPGAPALSSLVLRHLDGLPVGSTRGAAIMQAWADVYDAARDQAAAVMATGTLWLCGPCYENVARDLAQCEDGCSQPLDHTGACHPHEHEGETCTRCGEVDRLTPHDVENLDADDVRELFVRCPRCRGFHGPAGACGGPEDHEPGPWQVEELTASAYPPDRNELDASAYGTDRDRRPPIRVRSWLVQAAQAVAAEAWKPQTREEADADHVAFHGRSDLPWPSVLCMRCTPQTKVEPGVGLVADDEPEPAGPIPGSFHDPRVACCGRDAADCDCPATRLEYLRGELRAERISYGELAELQELAEHIDPGDVELLEAAGVPEHPASCERCGDTFDPDQAGTSDDPPLCTDCTAHNEDRVVL
jgi:hypothetical protein